MFERYSLKTNAYKVERKEIDGKRFLVVPAVMLVEGVHNGSAGAILHLAEEFGKNIENWNGRPVTVGHPQRDGIFVSANQPEMLPYVVGQVYKARLENDKLKAELWLDEKKLQDKFPEVYSVLMRGRPLEVSVGVYTDDEIKQGEWKGEVYMAVAKNYRPDHLAILVDEKGACSLEDGCGIRVNELGVYKEVRKYGIRIKYQGTESTPWSAPNLEDFGVEGRWADLSREEKERIASHFLIGNADAETYEDLKLPVVNPKTGKLNERALRAVISGRGAQVKGVDPELVKKARRLAYELLNEEFDADLEIPEHLLTGGVEMQQKIERLAEIYPSLYSSNEKREWLASQSEEVIDEMLAQTEIMLSKIEKLKNNKEVQVNEEVALKVLREKISDMKTFAELLPPELRKQFEFGQKLYAEYRNKLVNHILTNQAKEVWSREELEKLDDETLEKIAKTIAEPVNYVALGSSRCDFEIEEKLLPIEVWLQAKK